MQEFNYNNTAWLSSTLARILGLPLKPYGLIHAIGFIFSAPFNLLMQEKNALVMLVKKINQN